MMLYLMNSIFLEEPIVVQFATAYEKIQFGVLISSVVLAFIGLGLLLRRRSVDHGSYVPALTLILIGIFVTFIDNCISNLLYGKPMRFIFISLILSMIISILLIYHIRKEREEKLLDSSKESVEGNDDVLK